MNLVRFLRDKQGVAAVEAAILLPLFMFTILVCMDFAFVFHARTQLAGAVSVGAQYAVQAGQTVSASDANAFARRIAMSVAQNQSRIDDFTVTVTFNGSLDPQAFKELQCPSGSDLRPAGSTPKACGNGTISGRFVTIEARGNFRSLIGHNPIFGRTLELNDRVTARVQ